MDSSAPAADNAAAVETAVAKILGGVADLAADSEIKDAEIALIVAGCALSLGMLGIYRMAQIFERRFDSILDIAKSYKPDPPLAAGGTR